MFKKKVIKVTLKLEGKDEQFTTISGEKMNSVSYTGLRVSSVINYGNGSYMPTAEIRIFGLGMDKINKLLRIKWNSIEALQNTVKIEAGNYGEPLALAYHGNITFAYPDMGDAPNIALVIESVTGIIDSLKASKPISFREGYKVQDALKDICDSMNYQFENNGVDLVMGDSSFQDTGINKIKRICKDYQLDLYIENMLIAVAPRDGKRDISRAIITPKTGLIGYPTPTQVGVNFSAFYDPLLRFGAPVEIRESLIEMANNEWRIYGVRSILEANVPGGLWQSDVSATHKGLVYGTK